MKPYTPAEILQGGADDTRRGYSHLRQELTALQDARCWHWHRINIDPHVPLLDGEERLPSYPAPPEFAGNALVIPARPVDQTRLTPAGRWLYWLGGHTARREREHLIDGILQLRELVIDARTHRTSAERRTDTATVLQTAAAAHHRNTRRPATTLTADVWAVKLPGTQTWATPDNLEMETP